MQFTAVEKEVALLNPLKDMERRTIPVEIRFDPLTGRSSRICHFMPLNWPKPDLEALGQSTREKCPFCPERVMEITPDFPPEILPEGKLTSGDSVLFPNLAPYDSFSGVCVMGARHYLPLTEITPEFIAHNFALCREFFARVHALGHPESRYHVVNWNYLPPAGSSIIHPHLQVFVTRNAPNLLRQELTEAAAYHREHGTVYWDDLKEQERQNGERYLGRTGGVEWMMSYAPMGLAGDVLGVVDGAASTLDLTDSDLLDLGRGIVKSLAAYDQMGIYSFNLNFFPGAPGEESARFHVVLSPRAFFNQALAASDVAALRFLFNEPVCMEFPEKIAPRLREAFAG